MDRSVLESKSVAELREIAAALGLKGHQRLKKADLVARIVDAGAEAAPGPAGDVAAGADRAPAPAEPERRDDDAPPPAEPERGDRDDRAEGGREDDRDQGDRGDRDDRDDRDRDDRDDRGRNGDRDARRGRARGRQRGGEGGRNGDGEDVEVREGVLDLLPEGYGFLRCTGYLAGAQDVYVSQSFVRRFDLRRGDLIAGPIRRNRNSDKFPALARVERIEGEVFHPDPNAPRRPDFDQLLASYPTERFPLRTGDDPVLPRLVDLLAPIGRGQRGLLLAPPKAGKTTALGQLASAIEAAAGDVQVLALLVDERPEQVTEFEQCLEGEVVATTFDRPAEDHTQVAELVIERAKRLVERGQDVVVLLDCLTRLVRAYNVVVPSSGRILPGGVDPAALTPAKRLFAAARNIEDGGSLTILATAVASETSRMDQVIVEGFTDTATMELHLDAGLAQQRIWPAIDVAASGTRREERLVDAARLEGTGALRRALAGLRPEEGLPRLLDRLASEPSDEELLRQVAEQGLGTA
ncbi:MAG: transcription termination factor Rho [Nitriliruptoraceae bacterium]